MSYFTLYLYRFESSAGFSLVEQVVEAFGGKAGVTIFKYEDESNEEKLRKVNGIILSERYRKYDKNSPYDLYLTIVEYSKDRFMVIISALMDNYSEEDIIEPFKALNEKPEIHYFNKGSARDEALAYWHDVLSGITLAGKKDLRRKNTRDYDIAFPLKLKNNEKFELLLKREPKVAKTFLSSAVARLMCLINDSNGILFEDIHDGGRLSKIPVRCNDTVSTSAGRKELYGYFINSDLKDAIDYNDIQNGTGIDLENASLFSQSFVCESSYSELFAKMKVSNFYKIRPLNIGNVPLFVTFRMHEAEKSIQYDFDSKYFSDISIEGFHEAVGLLVDSFIEESAEPAVDKLLHKENDLAKKIEEIKIKCLKTISVFEGFADKDLEKIAKSCDIKQFFCQQNVIEKDALAERVFIIVSGKIQVNGTDMEGVSRPLYILKEKDVFGFESLGVEKKSSSNYSVYTDQCVLISLKADDILEECRIHPEILRMAFDNQNKLLLKFQKLWMLS